jgi:hypothetical protein
MPSRPNFFGKLIGISDFLGGLRQITKQIISRGRMNVTKRCKVLVDIASHREPPRMIIFMVALQHKRNRVGQHRQQLLFTIQWL